MKRRWLVESEGSEEHVEADEVEITAAGVLVFYRYASRQETERTLLPTCCSSAWRCCRLESSV